MDLPKIVDIVKHKGHKNEEFTEAKSAEPIANAISEYSEEQFSNDFLIQIPNETEDEIYSDDFVIDINMDDSIQSNPEREAYLLNTVTAYFDNSKSTMNLNKDPMWSRNTPFYLRNENITHLPKMPNQSFFVYPVTQKLSNLRKKNDKLRQQLGPDPARSIATQRSRQPSVKSKASRLTAITLASNNTQVDSASVAGRNTNADKPSTSNSDGQTGKRPSIMSFVTTVNAAVKANDKFSASKQRPKHKPSVPVRSIYQKPRHSRRSVRQTKPVVPKITVTPMFNPDSTKPHFLDRVQPVGNKPKRKSIFAVLHKPKKPEPLPVETEAAPEVPEEKEVEEHPVEDIPNPKCQRVKDCLMTPFRSLHRRLQKSEKLTCFFFSLLIALIVIVCLMIIIFPVAEYFYSHKDDKSKTGDSNSKT